MSLARVYKPEQREKGGLLDTRVNDIQQVLTDQKEV